MSGSIAGESGKQDRREFIESWMDLFRYMGRFRTWFILALLFAFIGTFVTLFGPGLVSRISNIIETTMTTGVPMDYGTIAAIAALVLVL